MLKFGEVILVSAIFLLNGLSSFSSAQEPAQEDDSSEIIERAVTRAIKDADKDKMAEEEALIAKLNQGLNEAIEGWLLKEKEAKELEMNKLVSQNWEQLSDFGPRVHSNYYLRGYDYRREDSDIIKTSSLLSSPYKAYLKITEMLYVEKEHAVNISDVKQFFYTVTTPIKANFDYKDGRFVFIGAERSNPSLSQGWSDEVLNRLKSPYLKF